MAELWLKYKDAAGEEKRVCVDKERFTVGRHSDNDLAIVDGRLSRDHAVIERFGDVFVITDRESSNGTELNGEAISEPATIANGDKLSLGGLDVEPEFVSDAGEASPDEQGGAEQAPASAAAPAAQADPGSGIPKAVFIVAPIFAVLILLGLGSLLFFGRTKPAANPVDISYSDKDESLTDKPKKDKDRSDPIRDRTDPVNAESPSANTTTTATTPPSTVTEPGIAKTEVNGSAFMRKIAQNDPRAFLIGEPAKAVYSKIKSLSSSAALASNIASARKNSAALKSLAVSKNLKPDLLAIAAITKLGNSSGDVLQTAQSMAATLDRLGTQLSNELGEECLVIIAAYDQGAAGDFMKMRNMLQDLATKMPDLARDIRTIWFLKKQGKITDAEYDFAVKFLAIGTIAQNPKDFGVSTEALTF